MSLVNEDLSVLGDLASQWPELKSMGIVVSIRQKGVEAATEDDLAIRFYISSKQLDARTLLESPRSHWLVESVHWSLDTAFREDDSLIRVGERAESFARIRQMSLNLLKNEKRFKASVKRKRIKCAMNESYLLLVLASLST